MMIKRYIILLTISSSFFFSGCGLYSLSAFGSCNQWEIYSEQGKNTNVFKIHICGSKLGYGHTYLDRKELKDIQDTVYPKLKNLIQNQSSLSGCRVKKESITFNFNSFHISRYGTHTPT